jgi:hypothetical protein
LLLGENVISVDIKKLLEELIIDIKTRHGLYDKSTLTMLDRVKHNFKCSKYGAQEVEISNGGEG